MAFTNEQRTLVQTAIYQGLARAESAWNKVGEHLVKKALAMDMMRADENVQPSIIPGHPWVSDGTPKVDEFIALVVDMRNSTDHLKTKLSLPLIKDGFQRVFYETSALLPAISLTTSFEAGVVTEYLGDGALVLFQVNKDDKEITIRCANRAARNCVEEMRELINIQLNERYKLPNINLGAGLAISNVLVTLVGSSENQQPKAIGECVWEASKLSGGTNAVHVSEYLWQIWPTSKNGKMQFHKASVRNVPGYRLQHG